MPEISVFEYPFVVNVDSCFMVSIRDNTHARCQVKDHGFGNEKEKSNDTLELRFDQKVISSDIFCVIIHSELHCN